jgi:uncharacterized delta-60 repeat protein
MRFRPVLVSLFRVSRLDPPRVVVLLLMLGVALFCTSNSALAQAGKLDTTFATGGIFTDSAGQFPGEPNFANAVAIQGDGKIVVGGSIGFSAAVLRLNGNGTLDSTFGTGGVVTLNFPADQVIGVAVQPNGKIVAALSNQLEDANLVFLAARLNPDGSLDSTFGTGGIVQTQIGPFGIANSVFALLPDGKILLAGDGAMARYDAEGQLDSTFGTDGVVAILASQPSAMAVQPDGKILIGAGAAPPGIFFPAPGLLNADFSAAGVISRYNVDGSLDTSFGIMGQAATIPVPAAISIQREGLFGDSRILVAGTSNSVNGAIPGGSTVGQGAVFGFSLARYTRDGRIDDSFGSGGGIFTNFRPAEPLAGAFALLLDREGNIIAAGTAGQPPAPTSVTQADLALARYAPNGAPDNTFGTNGEVTTGFGINEAGIYALALQTDGKIVAAGISQQNPFGGQVGGLVVARYLAQ